jgi:O-antigen ligase
MKLVVILFAIVVLLYAVAILKIVPGLDILLEPVMMISGKDMTFSNRSAIWEIIKEDMQNWPVLGAGYFAYWTGPDDLASPSHKFIARLFFYPFACHNGYLEVANDLGYVGLTVLLGYLAFFARQAIQLFLLERSQGTLYLGLFFHQCVINLSESEWFQVGQIMNILLMTTATFAMARTLAEYKRTGQLPPPRRV